MSNNVYLDGTGKCYAAANAKSAGDQQIAVPTPTLVTIATASPGNIETIRDNVRQAVAKSGKAHDVSVHANTDFSSFT
jgi:uncharacterized protein YaiE (UPF0345 family)